MSVEKRGFVTPVSYTELYHASGLGALMQSTIKAATIGAHREVSGYTVEVPTAEDLAEWEAANRLYQQLRQSKFWEEGLEGDFLLERPEPRNIPIYSESEQEFAERVDREYEKFAQKVKQKKWPFGDGKDNL